MSIITIHQPEHLVWNGLLDKIRQVDLFVILDDVQFEKNYFQNRNRIRKGEEWQWVTVPIKGHPLKTPINQIEISDVPWRQKYLRQVRETYKGSKNFETLYPKISEIIKQDYRYLIDLNLALLRFMMTEFNIEVKTILASSLKIPPEVKGSDRILEICKKVRATTYLSGQSGVNYLKQGDFALAGIKLKFHAYDTRDFLSAVDYLFNYA